MIENGLFYAVSNVVYGQGFSFHGRHLTVNQCASFSGDTQTNGSVTLTNSLLVQQTNWGVSTFVTNLIVVTTVNPFQTVGGGSCYLAPNSPYRGIGSTGIPVDLAADLKTMTTYPPVTIEPAAWRTNHLFLAPRTDLDLSAQDLGYHYQRLDFVVGGLAMTNATLVASNGVAIGTWSRNGYGLGLLGGSTFVSVGRPDAPNRIVGYNAVQEESTTNWYYNGTVRQVASSWLATANPPRIDARFTHWLVMGTEMPQIDFFGEAGGTNVVRDSEFHGGTVQTLGPTLLATNCLFNRCVVGFDDSAYGLQMNPVLASCTLYGGDFWIVRTVGGTWTFENNIFDTVSVLAQIGDVTNRYNGYTTNATRLTPNANTDVRLASASVGYQTAGLGRFYLPTTSAFINAGSVTNAGSVGLWHFCTTTNQVKETNSVLDLGYHVVAFGAGGAVADTDGDGLADYLEDWNGNGVKDASESNVNLVDTDGDGVSDFAEFLQGRNPNAASTNDVSGLVNLRVFSPLR